jgi:hypothetical protein
VRAALLAALALVGCTCPDPSAVIHASFEHCADATCGWQAGEGIELERVETIHPAEHGLALRGFGEARLAVSAQVSTLEQGGLWIEATSTCGGTATAAATALPSGGYRVTLWLPFDDPPEGPAYQALWAALPGPVGLADTLVVEELVVVNRREHCVIDEVRIMAESYCYY